MLNNPGIHAFDELTVIQFAMPESVLKSELGESVTRAYSQRLNTSYAPCSNYEHDLAALKVPFLLAAGVEDEAFITEAYEPTIAAQTGMGTYRLLPESGHVDLLTNEALFETVADWLAELK